ncbi:MAG TPA: tetratricopeptide repeat protein [Candidatus Binatia bacterium]|nr:tetratricopeptide repeat protein [Candidatus Binatia bacterium]
MRRPSPGLVFVLGATLYLAAVVAASLHPGPRAWGLHLVGFLGLPGSALVYGLLALGVLASAMGLLRSKAPEPTPTEPSLEEPADATGPERFARVRFAAIKAALMVLYAAALWLLRARTHFLGDGMLWVMGLREGKLPLPVEPLSGAIWEVASAGLRQIAAPVESLALVPIALGILAAWLSWQIARNITTERAEFMTAFLLLMTLGVGQLFFGYIESYPVLAVAILAYLWAGLRSAKRGGGGLLLVLAFAVAVASHLMALYLAPSLLYLILHGESSRPRRVGLIGLAVILPAAILVLLGSRPEQWAHTLDLATRAARTGAAAAATAMVKPYEILSLDHFADIGNEALLAIPVPLLLLLSVGAAGSWKSLGNSPERTFLVLAAGAGLLGMSVLVLPVAAAQDWDLYSMLLLPAAVLGVWAGRRVYSSGGKWIRAGVVSLSLGSLLAFVLVNASAAAGDLRYRTLVGPHAKITDFARWYAFESLAHYYRHRGDYALAVGYVDLLLRTQPNNARYWGMGGEVLMGMGRYAEAIPILEEGVRLDPHRATTRTNLGIAYSAMGRRQEALQEFRETVRIEGDRPDYRHNLGLAFKNMGELDSARVVWLEVRRRWPGYKPAAEAMEKYFGSAGP